MDRGTTATSRRNHARSTTNSHHCTMLTTTPSRTNGSRINWPANCVPQVITNNTGVSNALVVPRVNFKTPPDNPVACPAKTIRIVWTRIVHGAIPATRAITPTVPPPLAKHAPFATIKNRPNRTGSPAAPKNTRISARPSRPVMGRPLFNAKETKCCRTW